MKSPRVSPYLVLFIGILAVSTASILIRLGQKGAPSLVIATLRMGFSALILLPVALIGYRTDIRNIIIKEWLLLSLAGILLAFHFASWITSFEYTTIASSVVLVTSAPLWVALFSPFVLHERITKGILFGLIITLIGGTIVGLGDACQLVGLKVQCSSIIAGDHTHALFGNFLALAGAWFSAGYLMIGRKMRATIKLVPYIFIVYSISACILILMTSMAGLSLVDYPVWVFLIGIALAVLPQLIGHTSFNWALEYLPAAYVAISILGEPVGTIVLAYFILQEQPGLIELAGGILILIGIYLATRLRQS